MNRSTTSSQYGIPEDGADATSIREYLSTILRGKKTIAISFGIVLLITVIYTIATKTTYESSSLVLLNFRQEDRPSFSMTESNRNPSDNKIANELGQLRSHLIAESVAQMVLLDPYLDDAKTELAPVVRAKNSLNDSSKSVAPASVVGLRILKAMDFAPERESDVIRITARSVDPRESALLANAYAEVYKEYGVSSGRSRTRTTREFLQGQLSQKRRTLDSMETLMKTYMETSGVVSLDAQALRVTTQLSQLEANRDAIDIDLDALEKTLSTYQQRLPEQEKEVGRVMKGANDPYIRLIQEQLANLQVQRDVLANPKNSGVGNEVYTEKLKAIEAQIANLQKKLDDRTANYLSALPSGETGAAQADPAGYLVQAKQKIFESQMQIQALQAKKNALSNVIRQYENDFSGIPRKSIELAKLQRQRMSAEKLFLLVEERYNEAAISEKSSFGFIEIIDTAVVPSVPVSPNIWLNLVFGTFAGLALGLSIVFAREYIDARVNTPEDLKHRGYELLSFVGRMSGADADSNNTPGPRDLKQRALAMITSIKKRETGTVGPTISRKVLYEGKEYDHTLVSLLEPFSPASEAYRRLRAKLEFALPGDQARKLLVTSPNPGEGKTTSVLNLGITFAQAERRVLIVDCDLRRPAIHARLGLNASPGLAEVLTGQTTMQQAVHRNVIPNLDVICAGETRSKDPEILGSKHMAKFLKEIHQTYEWVLIDSSPVLAVSDVVNMLAMVDGAMIVVAGGETRILALERAEEFVVGTGGKLIGVLLNNFDARQAYGGFYGSTKYGYYGVAYGRVNNVGAANADHAVL